MRRKKILSILLLLLVTLSGLSRLPEASSLKRYEFRQTHMGTVFRLVLYASDPILANRAATAAFERIRRLDEILSDFRSNNELARVNAGASAAPQVVSPDFLKATVRALDLSQLTSGAFDITVKPLVRLWRRARKERNLPSETEIREAKDRIGYHDVLVNRRTGSIRFQKAGMELDFGAIGKGVAADEAFEVLARHGIRRALVDAGGDIRMGEAPPGREGWIITIDSRGDAALELSLADQAVASSGDKYQFVEIDGVRYSHIVDPGTGIGLRHSGLVTVLAKDATAADALATALSVLPPQAGLQLVEAMQGVAARIVSTVSGIEETYRSASFPP